MSGEDGSAILAWVTKRGLVTKSVAGCRGAFFIIAHAQGIPALRMACPKSSLVFTDRDLCA